MTKTSEHSQAHGENGSWNTAFGQYLHALTNLVDDIFQKRPKPATVKELVRTDIEIEAWKYEQMKIVGLQFREGLHKLLTEFTTSYRVNLKEPKKQDDAGIRGYVEYTTSRIEAVRSFINLIMVELTEVCTDEFDRSLAEQLVTQFEETSQLIKELLRRIDRNIDQESIDFSLPHKENPIFNFTVYRNMVPKIGRSEIQYVVRASLPIKPLTHAPAEVKKWKKKKL